MKLPAFFMRRKQRDQELDEEIRAHLAMAIRELIEQGEAPADAEANAKREFGNATLVKEVTRDMWGWGWLETFLQDIRYGLRQLRRNPGFTAVAIITLALGIGATTAVFSVIDPILFRSLPYANADRLVSVGVVHALQPEEFMMGGFYYSWKDNQKPFAALTSTAYKPDQCELTPSNPALLSCIGVEANFLPTLGVAPLVGRNFLPEEDRPNGPKVALISYRLWSSHFSRDPGILNKLVQIDGKPVRVIGVLPKNFEMPTLDPVDVLVPRALDETAQRKRTIGGAPMRAFARLKPGVSIAQARSQLEPLFRETLSLAPPFVRKQLFLSVRSMRNFQMHDVTSMAWILLGSVLAVLLIACANVASLFMARGAARERELAVRVVLGATRARLIHQTLTEAFLLALASAFAGCALAEILLRTFVAIAPAGILFLRDAHLDSRIILFTIVLSLICALLFGLATTAQKPSTAAVAAQLRKPGANATVRQILVVGQIAVSMILLSGAMLLLRSFWNLQEQNLGMRTGHVLTVRVSLSNFYATSQKQMEFYHQAEAALRRLPGVTAVALSDSLPPDGWHHGSWSGQMVVAGRPKPTEGDGHAVVWRWVTPDYFHALDIPIIQGQGFTEEERNSIEQFLILSKLLADQLFPAGTAIGQHIKFGKDSTWCVVVGVAGNVKNSGLASPSKPEYYRLRRDFAADWDPARYGIHSVISLETALPTAAVAPWVRAQIAAIDPTAPVAIATLNQQVSKLAARPRFETSLLAFFAFTGLMMAIIGLYGVISFLVARRTHEIGIRMALGAQKSDVLKMVVGQGLKLVIIGAAVGIAGALLVTQFLSSLLYGVKPTDPLTFIAVSVFLAAVALLACYIPARRAAKVDPMVALRHE